MKALNVEAKRRRTMHDAFIWMLYACVQSGSKFFAGSVIEYYFNLAFGRNIRSYYDLMTVNNIRKRLLINAGVRNPVLHDTKLIRRIYTGIALLLARPKIDKIKRS